MNDPIQLLMRDALAEGRKGLGLTAPNPPVGAVVVRDGRVVGRGHHERAGAPHAEPIALADAGAAAEGADLVVTLEPCCTAGKTPPCTEAILRAGIRRVFVGCTDPNPVHAGRGLSQMEQAGVEVRCGILEPECRELIRAFAYVQRTGLPYVTLKLACTLDGRIADGDGNSKWITGDASRERVQAFRREADAMLVGTNTVLRDNPSLMPRPARGRLPWRVVPDRTGRLPLDAKVFTDASAERTLCLLGPRASKRKEELEHRGVRVRLVEEKLGALDWEAVLTTLAADGINHVLCEGGGKLASSLMRNGFVQELHWMTAPKLLGDAGTPAVAGGWTLPEAPEFRMTGVERLGDDVWMRLTI